MNTIKLRGPSGGDECNIAGRMFHPKDDGFFHIDADLDIEPLLRVGGFSRVDDAPVPPVVERRPVMLADIDALARKLPHDDVRARLLGAIAEIARTVPRQTVKVRPPIGTTGFSHGGEHFEAGDDGLIDAPIDCLDSICDGPAGFSLAPVDPPPSALADDETPADDEAQADDAEPAENEPIASAPAVEVATPFASAIPRLVFPAIQSRSLAASDC